MFGVVISCFWNVSAPEFRDRHIDTAYRRTFRRGHLPSDLDLTKLRPTQAVIETEELGRDEALELRDLAYREWERAKQTVSSGDGASATAIKRRLGGTLHRSGE